MGPFQIGAPIEKYIVPFGLVPFRDNLSKPYELSWQTFDVPEARAQIHVKQGKIETISCYEVCLYKGINLIATPLEKALGLLSSKPEEREDGIEIGDETQATLYFWSLGLQLWLHPDESIASVFCTGSCQE